MFKYVLIPFLLIITSLTAGAHYDMSTPVEGDSIANDSLQFEVIKKMYKILSPRVPTCYDFSIKNTQVIHYPYDVKKKQGKIIKGFWKELWTVNCCDMYKQVPVTFYISPKTTQFKIDENFII